MGVAAIKEFIRAVEKLRAAFPRTRRLSDWNGTVPPFDSYCAAYHLIDLNDLWGDFCRELVIGIAVGKAQDFTGLPIALYGPAVSRPVALSSVVNVRGHEPRWHDAREATRAANKFPSSKTAQIGLALSATSSPAPFINTARNYFCHRRSNCRDRLQASGGYQRAMEFNAFRIGNCPMADGRRLIDFWIDELTNLSIACIN